MYMHQAAALLEDVRNAIESGDEDAFRSALLCDIGKGAPGVSPDLAEALRFGFQDIDDPHLCHSLAKYCAVFNQPDLLRIAIEAKHPSTVAGRRTKTTKQWLGVLQTRYRDGAHSGFSLVQHALWDRPAKAVEFIKLALEFDPSNRLYAKILAQGGDQAALVTEAQMRRAAEVTETQMKARIESILSSGATTNAAAESSARRRRSNMI